MKKIVFLLFMFTYTVNVEASDYTDLYISKKDINTKEYVTDCDFLLYDSNDNIVDAWVSSDEVYHLVIKKGSYRLVERPLIEETFSDGLSKIYKLDINSDEAMEITLYNKKIETPRNLGINSNVYLIASIFILFGFGIIIIFFRQFSRI